MFYDLFLNVQGKKSVYIENYKNIVDYKEDKILIQGKRELLKITGNHFKIEYFTNDNMKIVGSIDKIEIEEV